MANFRILCLEDPSDLLAKYTAMPVAQVETGMVVERNHIYVIPPNTYMTINSGILHLKPPSAPRGMRMPIDRFLFSLAKDRKNQAIVIILSGSGTDGTLGIREIRANGGMVVAQDPDTAQYDGMPRSVIATGQADAVLPLERIPGVLSSYVRHTYTKQDVQSPTSSEASQGLLNAVLSLLLTKTGHDFRCYKKGTLARRVHRRMGIAGAERLEDYLELLRKQEEEVRVLSKDLFIGVTSFFRETDAWSEIAEKAVAPIVANHTREGPVRVWVPGCATGEEVYTLAMLFAEAYERVETDVNLLVFATDVDGESIWVAREGRYQQNIIENLSSERLSRFFSQDGNGFRVKSVLRDLIVFTQHNLIADPPFSKLDLISCRNLLIYLEPTVQERVVNLFHFALNPGGYLVLGSSDYLAHPPGELTDDLIAMTRNELRLKTRTALHQASGENRQVVQHGIRIKLGETVRSVAITVTPLHQPANAAGLLLVSFHREPEAAHQPPGHGLGQGPEAEMVRELEAELKTTRNELQCTIEELETSNEELKALNEEVLSMNEELQSSKEELETSKEELQSVNEELTTVNNQLQNKVAEVESANNAFVLPRRQSAIPRGGCAPVWRTVGF